MESMPLLGLRPRRRQFQRPNSIPSAKPFNPSIRRSFVRVDVELEIVWWVAMFRFAFFTGMRMSELSRLRWGDIDMDMKTVTIVRQNN